MIGCSDVSLGFGGSSEPRGAGPALPGGPGLRAERSHLQIVWLLEPGPERAGGGAGHRLRAALGRRGRAPLRRGWAGRPGRPAARERGRQAAAGGRGRGGAAGRPGRAARRRGAVDGAEGGDVDGGPARPQGLAATRLDYLKKLGYSAQRPRPRHAKAASPEEQKRRTKKAGRPGGRVPRGGARAAGRGVGVRRAPARPEAGPATAMGSPGSAADRGRATVGPDCDVAAPQPAGVEVGVVEAGATIDQVVAVTGLPEDAVAAAAGVDLVGALAAGDRVVAEQAQDQVRLVVPSRWSSPSVPMIVATGVPPAPRCGPPTG